MSYWDALLWVYAIIGVFSSARWAFYMVYKDDHNDE